MCSTSQNTDQYLQPSNLRKHVIGRYQYPNWKGYLFFPKMYMSKEHPKEETWSNLSIKFSWLPALCKILLIFVAFTIFFLLSSSCFHVKWHVLMPLLDKDLWHAKYSPHIPIKLSWRRDCLYIHTIFKSEISQWESYY